jgi:signal transduction histidine kinase
MIAHEVRTPATVVRAALGMISADRELADRAAELNIIAMANRNAERLSNLLDNFFELEKLDQGAVELRSEPQPLKPLVERALQLESSRAQAAKITLTLRWRAPEQLSVPVDGSRLEQVLSNLIANAVQHSSVGQSVEVSVQMIDSRARLAVRDYGPGIPVGFRPRLFQRFAQADMSDSRPKGGVGLGLALSKEYVELMGGSIDVDCPAEGGTIFGIELPASGGS